MLTMKGQIECKRVVNWSAILRQVGTRLIRQGVLSGRLRFEVSGFNSGWYRITLKNLDMAKIEEPPATAPSSYSMPMRREKLVSESRLLIPATRPIVEQWIQESIVRMARSLAY